MHEKSEWLQNRAVINNKYFCETYECTEEVPIMNDEGTVIDWEIVGYKQLKTAQKVYEEYLNPSNTLQPSLADKISILESELLESKQAVADLEIELLILK